MNNIVIFVKTDAKIIKFCTMAKEHDIMWLDEVDSTNKYARRHIESLDNLSVVSALSQTEGKGQGEHTWHSKAGENLLFSVILKNPPFAASDQKIISDMTASAIVSLLHSHGIEAWIKPPNDIWVDRKKICGILIEHSLIGQRISWSIIGVGLNVNQTDFPADLPNPTSMAAEKSGADIRALLSEFMDIFMLSLQQSQRQDPQP